MLVSEQVENHQFAGIISNPQVEREKSGSSNFEKLMII